MSKKFTFRMLRNSLMLCAAVAVMSFMTQDANAQSCGYGGYGGRGVSIGIGGFGYGGGYGYRSYRPSYYHNTSHYDYHGPSLRRHGNHFDYVPGHYHFHRTGHWHH